MSAWKIQKNSTLVKLIHGEMILSSAAPIALFAFNRPMHLQQTLDALAANELADESAVTIFCDGPRNGDEVAVTNAVRSVAHAATGFASVAVMERERNYGCAFAIIDGLKQMFAMHENLIVLEDDILASPYTLRFLNEGLQKYKLQKTVFNISAWSPPSEIFSVAQDYPYDVYAIPRFNCWGWASWRDRFELVDWEVIDYTHFIQNYILQSAFNQGGDDLTPMLREQMEGRIDAWDIRMDYARFKQGCVGINPIRSYTTNIGMGSGTHTTVFTNRWDNDIALASNVDPDFRWLEHISVDTTVLKSYRRVYSDETHFLYKTVRSILARLRLLTFVKKLRNALRAFKS